MKIGYYIHHEGSGHLQRAKLIAPYFSKDRVTFFSSLDTIEELSPYGETIKLPMDSGPSYAKYSGGEALHSFLPYFNSGLAERNAIMANWVVKNSPLGFHIDVSTEVAEFVTLLGLPYTYVRQSGIRDDLFHKRVYSMAQALLAPYPKEMEDSSFYEASYSGKTLWLPVFNKLKMFPLRVPDKAPRVLILKSSTSESLKRKNAFLKELSMLPRDWNIVWAGNAKGAPENILDLGWIDDINGEVEKADLVICSAGNNIAQEIMSSSRPVVFAPEKKHYNEQLAKAIAIESSYGAPYIDLDQMAEGELVQKAKEALARPRITKLAPAMEEFARAIESSLNFWRQSEVPTLLGDEVFSDSRL